MLVPQDALMNLKCSECNNYLSIFPIHCSKLDESFTCGRCITEDDTQQRKAFAYEALAGHLSFPCQYERYGCFKTLTPEKLAEHECICTYKPFRCPCLPENSCLWNGKPSQLYEHYKDNHRTFTFHHFKQEANLVNSYVENYVFLHNNETFIAKFDCKPNQNKFSCRIEFCGLKTYAAKYSYIIAFFSNNEVAYELPKRPVDVANSERVNADNTTVIEINLLKSRLLDPPYILCRIKIEENDVEDTEKLKKLDVTPLNEPSLESIECPICMTYIVPPIMQCITGHNICNDCKMTVSNCPKCRKPIEDTRNFAMEEFTKLVKYPCKYRSYGCRNVWTASNIREHESECEFVPVYCPVDTCDWKHNSSLMTNHVGDCHGDIVLHVNTIVFACTFGEIEQETYLVIFNDQVFKLEFKYDGSDFYWFLQLMGPSKDHDRYMFELDISNEQKILIRKACGTSDVTKLTNEERPYIHLCGDMLKDVMHDDILSYNFRIVLDND